MEIVENCLAPCRGNDYAIIQAEDIVRAEEQVFSMFEVPILETSSWSCTANRNSEI